MKRYCKNVDITNTKFIEECIWDCLCHRSRRDYYRPDIQRVINEYGTIDKMAQKMSEDIKARSLSLPPVKYDVRKDRSNGKVREISIEDIWQQFYDYVAAHALKDAMCKLGYYQCGCVDGKGQVWGMKMLKGFITKYRYVTHSDAQKCYPSIPQDRLFAYLRRVVKNEPLLWLIETLVKHTSPHGISIGSRLSIPLCQLYLSQAYHHMEEFAKTRRGKRVKIVKAQLYFMDDIYMASDNASDLVKAEKKLSKYFEKVLGMKIKPSWTLIDTENATLDCMGFRINKHYTKMRRINYLRTKKAIKKFKRNPCMKTAQNLATRTTNIKYTDSYRFCKKYRWKEISRKARRLISYESKIHGEATGGCGYTRWQYDLLPDSNQCEGNRDCGRNRRKAH